jgi:hypothetical protein
VPVLGDAGALYDAGSAALVHGSLGPAVLYLRAAQRLEPRADDIARNLGIAEARVALARGESGAGGGGGLRAPVSAAEGWWIATLLVALGIVGMARRFRSAGRLLADPAAAAIATGTPRPAPGSAAADRATRLARRTLDAAGLLGLAVMAWLSLSAAYDAIAPEAVVMEREVKLTAASGQPLPGEPALEEGETVRIGREREGQVEVRLGGTSVGWARRAAFWRVRDARGYTDRFMDEERRRREENRG